MALPARGARGPACSGPFSFFVATFPLVATFPFVAVLSLRGPTMNPDADRLWRGPRWALAALLATLGMLGPFSIDTYLPAFSGIATSIGATPVEMQQTLSAYLFGFALM